MPKLGSDFDASQYAPVADRIALFYQRYPEGQILTRLVARDGGQITFVARVYRWPADARPSASGWASERIDDGDVNAVACLENTETSAVGRALANLGFTASRQRPSREEMDKATRERLLRYRRSAAASESPASYSSISREPLQRFADVCHDLLLLLERAEALGFSVRRADILRRALAGAQIQPATVSRLESRVRAWMARHRARGW